MFAKHANFGPGNQKIISNSPSVVGMLFGVELSKECEIIVAAFVTTKFGAPTQLYLNIKALAEHLD